MKVVPKVTVLDRIRDEIAKLHNQDREPEYVVVTREEYAELKHDRRVHGYLEFPDYFARDAAEVADATFTTRDFERHPRHRASSMRYPFIRVASHEKFMGVPLYVVPKEYHPD